MKKAGIPYGMENTFPFAAIEEIDARKGAGSVRSIGSAS